MSPRCVIASLFIIEATIVASVAGDPITAASARVSQATDGLDACPMGADYLATLSNTRGVRGIAWDGDALLLCVPDALENAGFAGQLQRTASLPLDDSTPLVSAVSLVAPTTLGYAMDVAVSASGAIAVADRAGVVHMRAKNASSSTIIGAGVFEEPVSVAWRGDALVVADANLRALLVLDQNGVESQRIGVGQLMEPSGIAVASSGDVFVADRLADCLWHYPTTSDGTLATVGTRIGESGSNPGQFSAPRDVAIVTRAQTNCLLVADEMNHRIQVLDEAGGFVGFFGMHALLPRQGEGRIHYPVSLAVALDGITIAVAEAFEDRVQVLQLKLDADPVDPSANSGGFISSHFGPDVGCSADILAVIDCEIEAIALCDARTTPPIHMCVIGGGGALPMRFGEISAVAVLERASSPATPATSDIREGEIWVADRFHQRIDVFRMQWNKSAPPVFDQFLPRLVRSMDLESFAQRLPVPQTRYGLRVPEIVDIESMRVASSNASADEDVLLLDRRNRALIRSDARLHGGVVELLPAEARGPEECAVAADGRIAVADPIAQRVFLRATDGTWSALSRLGEIALIRPSGVGFSDDGALVISDSARDAIVVGSIESARVVGERGVLDEQFWDTQGIAQSPAGLIVIDRGNHRFQRFGHDRDNSFKWNLTGTLGRFYDQKRRGSPGAALEAAPTTKDSTTDSTTDSTKNSTKDASS